MTVNQTTSLSKAQYKAMRDHMIDSQLRTSDVNDLTILAAIARTPREDYVPDDRKDTSYMDRAIPLGEGRSLNPPLTVGRMLVAAELVQSDKVLLIGAATGYTAEILSHLVAEVVAVEESPALAAIAREKLKSRPNVTVLESPLSQGAADYAPYNIIIIDGAVEELPSELIHQLSPEGYAVGGVVDRGVTRLCRGARVGDELSFAPFADMEAVILPGFSKPKVFSF